MSLADDSDPLNIERLRQVLRPIGDATGLPNVAYTSSAHFRYERDTLLGRTWVGIAFTDTVPDRAFAQPVESMGLPLLVVRDRHGQLRVFHNVCSHRGMQLVGEPTEIRGLITCRYHCWGYATNGDLKATPHIGGVDQHHCSGFDNSKHGLKPVRSAVFMGILVVLLRSAARRWSATASNPRLCASRSCCIGAYRACWRSWTTSTA